jgi:hypothetical protein
MSDALAGWNEADPVAAAPSSRSMWTAYVGGLAGVLALGALVLVYIVLRSPAPNMVREADASVVADAQSPENVDATPDAQPAPVASAPPVGPSGRHPAGQPLENCRCLSEAPNPRYTRVLCQQLVYECECVDDDGFKLYDDKKSDAVTLVVRSPTKIDGQPCRGNRRVGRTTEDMVLVPHTGRLKCETSCSQGGPWMERPYPAVPGTRCQGYLFEKREPGVWRAVK